MSVVKGELPITHYPLPITHYPLPITNLLLSAKVAELSQQLYLKFNHPVIGVV
ncbi:hypothetical protein H6G25_02900 [Dolichospermum sp. FACHB-1091]|uniref:hypothetical protein n=1 Tax=Dolichospermum sp. FACHB-1091 TaxID=2692798 RepID=UPI00168157C2|nr:hypothetical protein [Dolichospermum sp. FACHB-1091]MBD2442170.1 hypothetical protein [Dolichospermum sp. FACHB-1091]